MCHPPLPHHPTQTPSPQTTLTLMTGPYRRVGGETKLKEPLLPAFITLMSDNCSDLFQVKPIRPSDERNCGTPKSSNSSF